MPFMDRHTHQTITGIFISAMMQLSTKPDSGAEFVLYESLEGHGFFLRENKEFMDRFTYYTDGKTDSYWYHKVKGGKYKVHHGMYRFDGNGSDWDSCIHDGDVVSTYVDGQGHFKFVKNFADKFVFVADDFRQHQKKANHDLNYSSACPRNWKNKFGNEKFAQAAVRMFRENYDNTVWVNMPKHSGKLTDSIVQTINGKNELPASLPFIEQNFIQVYKDDATHVAVVNRTGHKAVAIRGDDLDYVLKAADSLLLKKS